MTAHHFILTLSEPRALVTAVLGDGEFGDNSTLRTTLHGGRAAAMVPGGGSPSRVRDRKSAP